MGEMNKRPPVRRLVRTLPNGLRLYRVKLVGGPADGLESICTHDIVFWHDNHGAHRYLRAPDDLYYYEPCPRQWRRK